MTGKIENSLKDAPESVSFEGKAVGKGSPTYFIAEIGNNHNGDFFLAKRSIQEAAKAGADAVKLQKRFIGETFAKELKDKPLDKQEIKGNTYGEYREGLELSLEEFKELKEVAKENNVAFFATPFDIKSVDFLEEVDIPFYKIASFDVTNLPLLDYVAKLNKPIILSVGMATKDEVDQALETIFKYHKNVVLLHCVSIYPTPDEDINVNTMNFLKETYAPLPVGYSGHEQDILATLVAVANGATMVERHFTLSSNLPGPDQATVSIEPDVFKEMVDSAARIHKMYGQKSKEILEPEQKARDKHSKSIVSKVAISKGTEITKEMLTFKSPGYGLKPREIDSVVGKKAANDIGEDEVIKKEDLE